MDEAGKHECPCMPQQGVQISPASTGETPRGFQQDGTLAWVMFQNGDPFEHAR